MPVPAGPMPNVRSCARMLSRYSRWLRAARRGCRRAACGRRPRPQPSGATRIVGLRKAEFLHARCTRSGDIASLADSSNIRRSTAVARSRPAPAGRAPAARGRGGALRRRGAPRCGAGSLPSDRAKFASRALSGAPPARCSRDRERDRSSDAPLRGSRDRRPRSEFGIASVMTTSANRPMSAAGPSKFTQRLFSVRPASWRASRFDGTLDQHALHGADHRCADRARLRVELRLQPLEALLLHFVRHVVRQRRRGRAGPPAVDEAEGLVEADVARRAPASPRSRAPSRPGSRR